MVFNNKKALAFPILMPLIVVILVILFMIVAVNPIKNLSEEVDFGSVVLEVDSLLMKKPAEEFYKKTESIRIHTSSKETFTQSLQLASSSNIDSSKKLDPEKMVICKIDSLNLWYNEIGVDLSSNDIIYSDCLPKFGDVDTQFINHINNEIANSVNSYGDTDVEIIPSDIDDDYIVKVSSSPTGKSKFSQVNIDYTFENKISLNSYTDLLKTLESVLPKLSLELKRKVPLCLNQDKDEIMCINEIFDDLVKKENSKVSSDYYFILTFFEIDDEEISGKYFGLKVEVYDLSETKQFEFGVILKDTIPYSTLNFNLLPSKKTGNFIDVIIDRPTFYEEVKNYLIVYSYEDFLATANPNSNRVIETLEKESYLDYMSQGKDGEELKDSNSNKYFYSKDLGITLMLTDKSFSNVDGGDDWNKTVSLYQIYNPNSNKFEFITKKIFVYAFALDENRNLFIGDIKDNAKDLYAKGNLIPLSPLSNKLNTATGNIFGKERSISVVVKGYDDPNFDHFDIYILESGSKFVKNCDNSQGCYYYDGKGILTKDRFNSVGDFSFLITSMASVDFPNVVYTNAFSTPFSLVNNKAYSVYVVPENSENKGYYSTGKIQTVRYDIREPLNFRVKDTKFDNLVENKLLKFDNIKVEDTVSPSFDDFNIKGIKIDNNRIILEWEAYNDVAELYVESVKIKNNDGTIASVTPQKRIDLNGVVGSWTSTYNEIIFEDITPVDSSGNFADPISPVYSKTYPLVIS